MSDFLIEPKNDKRVEDSTKGLINRRLLEIGYVLTPDGEPIIKLRKTLTDDIMREAGPAPVNATLAERKAWMNKVRKSARKHVKAEVERILDTSSKR